MSSRTDGVVTQRYEERVELSTLEHHPDNPRQGDIGEIGLSIETNGFAGAIYVQESTRRIIAGNHRVIAARQRGMTHLPVIWLDVDDDRALRLLLADNRLADKADYDRGKLVDLLTTLNEMSGLAGTGYDLDSLNELVQDMSQSFVPDTPAPPAEAKQPRDLGPVGDLKYSIIVECSGEEQQASLLEQFEAEGLTCRALIS